MSFMDELKSLGADVDEGLDRVVGDEELYTMMLGMFQGTLEENHIDLAEFDAGGDLEELIKKVHSLKGITGNLALTPLFTGYTEILGQLRAGQAKQGKAGYEKLLPVQTAILDCIQRNQGA